MKRLVILILLIFLCEIVSSLSVDFSCPEKVDSNSEFTCNLLISDSESQYDVKLDFLCDGKRVSKIWDGNQWKSSNYYLIDFIYTGSKEIKMKVENLTDNCDGFLKLRKTGKTSIDYQQNVSIGISDLNQVEEKEEEQETIIDDEEEKEEEKADLEEDLPNNESPIITNTESIIKLNSDEEVKEIIYQSKDEIIKKNLLIGFSVFLLIVIVILIIKK